MPWILFYHNLQSNKFEREPVGSDSASQQLRLEPLVTSSVESAVRTGNAEVNEADCPSHSWQRTATILVVKMKPTFLVELKGVSKDLMKAIVKPAVSHIVHVYNKFEVSLRITTRVSQPSLSYFERFIRCQNCTEKRPLETTKIVWRRNRSQLLRIVLKRLLVHWVWTMYYLWTVPPSFAKRHRLTVCWACM